MRVWEGIWSTHGLKEFCIEEGQGDQWDMLPDIEIEQIRGAARTITHAVGLLTAASSSAASRTGMGGAMGGDDGTGGVPWALARTRKR